MNDASLPFGLENFTLLAEASPMPTAIYVGEELVIGVANKAMLKLWGKPATIIGKTLSEALPELNGQPFFSLLQQVFATGETYEAKEDRADLVVDGKLQTFYFTFTYKPLRYQDNKTIAVINTATDVTELVNTRREIEETEERLSRALQSAASAPGTCIQKRTR